MSTRWDQVTALFDSARALGPAERAAFLEAACGEDHTLRDEVESLLHNGVHDSG